MIPLSVRVAAALLLGALAGCQAPTSYFQDARLLFDRPRYRRGAADITFSGKFPTPAEAAEAPVAPDVPDPAVRGTVTGVVRGVEVPLANALVSTSDGRAGRTGADGRFAIAGAWPADGGLVAIREGYVASAVAALPADEPAALHLRSRATESTARAAVAERPFTVGGRVVDGGGTPQSGVFVVLADAAGAFSAPAESGADGRFTLTVFAPGRAIAAGTLLAVGRGAPSWLGIRTGVVAAAPATAPEMTDEPAAEVPGVDAGALPPDDLPPGQGFARTLLAGEDADVGDLPVGIAGDPLRVDVDAAAIPGLSLRVSLAVVAPDGTKLDLPPTPDGFQVAQLPEARFELRVEAEDVIAGVASSLRRLVRPNAGQVGVALLAPPAGELDPALLLNEKLDWRPVAGAGGYQVTLAGVAGEGFLWEGFTVAPTMPFSFQAVLPRGPYGLTITAWDAADLAPRALAGADAPRALRLPAGDADWRKSSRRLSVQI